MIANGIQERICRRAPLGKGIDREFTADAILLTPTRGSHAVIVVARKSRAKLSAAEQLETSLRCGVRGVNGPKGQGLLSRHGNCEGVNDGGRLVTGELQEG